MGTNPMFLGDGLWGQLAKKGNTAVEARSKIHFGYIELEISMRHQGQLTFGYLFFFRLTIFLAHPTQNQENVVRFIFQGLNLMSEAKGNLSEVR